MFIWLYSVEAAYGQTTITGTVPDENGQKLAGVSVKAKETTSETATGNDGKFRISVPLKAVLVFNYIGYKNRGSRW